MARRVGDAGQPVGVVGVRAGLAVLAGHRCPPSPRIVRKRGRGGIGRGDLCEPGHGGCQPIYDKDLQVSCPISTGGTTL
jgi:hypothetical protein